MSKFILVTEQVDDLPDEDIVINVDTIGRVYKKGEGSVLFLNEGGKRPTLVVVKSNFEELAMRLRRL